MVLVQQVKTVAVPGATNCRDLRRLDTGFVKALADHSLRIAPQLSEIAFNMSGSR